MKLHIRIHGYCDEWKGRYLGGSHLSTHFKDTGEPISTSVYPELEKVIEETALFSWGILSYRVKTETGEVVVRSIQAQELEETYLAQALRQRRCGYATKLWCARLPAPNFRRYP